MCIFCKIVNNEIPSYKLYEDENFIVILDRFPSSLGHALVIPKKHVETIFELGKDKELTSKIFVLAAEFAEKIKIATGCEGMNVLQNNGALAGQSVYHLHIHLIPRYQGDEVSVHWESQDPSDEDFKAFIKKVGFDHE